MHRMRRSLFKAVMTALCSAPAAHANVTWLSCAYNFHTVAGTESGDDKMSEIYVIDTLRRKVFSYDNSAFSSEHLANISNEAVSFSDESDTVSAKGLWHFAETTSINRYSLDLRISAKGYYLNGPSAGTPPSISSGIGSCRVIPPKPLLPRQVGRLSPLDTIP